MKIKILATVVSVALIVLLVYAFISPDPQPTSIRSEKDAIETILVQYPELAVYQTTNLPPSSIESTQSAGGWYVGFIRRGSGVQGILDAKCYFVNSNKTITSIGAYTQGNSDVVENIDLETCKSVAGVPPIDPILPDIDTGLKLGESGRFKTISITPLSVEEDSRCPSDVTCIQAGTVRLKIQVVGSAGTATSIVKLGQEFTTQGMNITLTDVIPAKNSKINTEETDYRFTLMVTEQDVPVVTTPVGACYRGGCSSQICSDQQDMVSTCEYREEYACYQSAVCERQTSGQCGWTQTPELRACLTPQAL